MTVTSDDIVVAAELCSTTLRQAEDADWDATAGVLDWTCRHTLDHIANTSIFYATALASRAEGPMPKVRNGDPAAPVGILLSVVPAAASILAEVAKAAGHEARGWHPAGVADAEGFLAMGCDEVLVHTADIAAGLGVGFAAPVDLCQRVVARLFPWAPIDTEPWSTLWWANGRAPLGDRPRLDPDWSWHCAPLAEWDGTVKRRSAPPGWA